MIEKIGRGKPYKWKYSGISGRKEFESKSLRERQKEIQETEEMQGEISSKKEKE